MGFATAAIIFAFLFLILLFLLHFLKPEFSPLWGMISELESILLWMGIQRTESGVGAHVEHINLAPRLQPVSRVAEGGHTARMGLTIGCILVFDVPGMPAVDLHRVIFLQIGHAAQGCFAPFQNLHLAAPDLVAPDQYAHACRQ
jgi:hypothetical protein